MTDEAKPGALALAMEKSEQDEPPAAPDVIELQDAGSAVMRAMRRGDTEVFTRALEAFLDAREGSR